MFRTLSKYTDFSPSLDMKMEADTLLWEKLEGAKYIRKSPKQHEELERIKTGLLVDMTRESGYLEFRQTDRSRYNFESRDLRILALWKVQKLNQNHYLIQIKIPQEPPIEDKYEYTLKDGLQEINLKESKSKQNKNNSWKSDDNKSARSAELSEQELPIKRQDSYIIKPQSNTDRYKIPDNYKINKAATRLIKPTQYYTLLGFQTPPAVPKYQAWRQPNDYYSVNSYKIFPEFKQDTEYNGFIPSLGPTGNPPVYQSNPIEPISYQIGNYYPTYPSPQILTTHKPLPITYFKPSAQFIQYSEVDPYYTSDENYTYEPMITAELPVVNPTQSTVDGYQQIIYKSPLPSFAIEVPPLNPGESLYDSAINTINNETSIRENAPEPTITTLIINYSQNTNNLNEKLYTTNEVSMPISLQLHNSSTNEKTTKIQIKNTNKSPHLSSLTGAENYDYAPLYIKWGEKIKPSENKNKTIIKNEAKLLQKINQFKEITIPQEETNDNVYESFSISNTETSEEENESTTTVANDIKQSIYGLDYTTTAEPLDVNTTNYVISNITVKTPEEIVSDLTTMGLVNSTILISGNRNEHYKMEHLENAEIHQHNKELDNQEEGSEPISVVVNRISQSYSYKTSVGHIGNLKQLPEKT